jgi:hypothetical protein
VSPARSPRRTEVVRLRPNPLAWNAALKLAGGDAKRIEVLAPDELVVHNSPLR